jgi:hypothetical protein
MGELESLWLILAAIYAAECLHWLRRDAVGFATWFTGRWRCVQSGRLLGNQRGGFVLANPVPPFGAFLVSQPFPLSLSPEAVLSYSPACLNPAGRPATQARLIRWEEIKSVTVEMKKVLVNGEVFFAAASPFEARRLAAALKKFSRLAGQDREAAFRQMLLGQLNEQAVAARLEEAHGRLRPIRILAHTLFLSLFVVAPLVIWQVGIVRCWPYLLIGLLSQTISQALLFRRAHAALFPDGKEERFTPFLTMLLAPPTAIRAPDVLTRHLLEGFHPLAVAKALCVPEDFKHLARQVLVDLRFPLLPVCPTDDPDAVAAEQWMRTGWEKQVLFFLLQSGLKPEETALLPPQPEEPDNRSYCQRCGAQFVTSEGVCADCGGRPLRRFATL